MFVGSWIDAVLITSDAPINHHLGKGNLRGTVVLLGRMQILFCYPLRSFFFLIVNNFSVGRNRDGEEN